MERMTYGPEQLKAWASEFIKAAPEIVNADKVGVEAALKALRNGCPVIRYSGGTSYCWLSLGQLHAWLAEQGKSRIPIQTLATWAVQAGWEKATFHAGGVGWRLWRFPWHE